MKEFILTLETLQSEIKSMQNAETSKELLTKSILHYLEANIKKLRSKEKDV